MSVFGQKILCSNKPKLEIYNCLNTVSQCQMKTSTNYDISEM